MKKLGIFISHPIHYQTPLYQLLAKQSGIKTKVYFYSRYGAEKYFDPQFQKEVILDTGLLNGYTYEFLKNQGRQKGFNFFSFMNWGIPRIIKSNKFDAVLINSWSYFSDWLVILAAILFRTSILIRAENPYNQEIFKPLWKRLIKKILLGKLIFPRFRTFLYIGQENKKFYQYYGVPERKLFFAPYCVDNEKFSQAYQELLPKRNVLRQALGISPETVVVLSLGSKLIQKKRQFDLLKAYESVPQGNKALIFLGDGELRHLIEQYIKEKNIPNVFLVGFQPQAKIPEFYAMADIAVLPSGEGETWGLMVNEAMNFSLPIIVSDMVGCGPDLVKHSENGFIFPLGDTEKLREYMMDIVGDNKKRREFGSVSSHIVDRYLYTMVLHDITVALGAV